MGDKSRVLPWAQWEVKVHKIETEPFLPRLRKGLGIGFDLIRRIVSGHEAGTALQTILMEIGRALDY